MLVIDSSETLLSKIQLSKPTELDIFAPEREDVSYSLLGQNMTTEELIAYYAGLAYSPNGKMNLCSKFMTTAYNGDRFWMIRNSRLVLVEGYLETLFIVENDTPYRLFRWMYDVINQRGIRKQLVRAFDSSGIKRTNGNLSFYEKRPCEAFPNPEDWRHLWQVDKTLFDLGRNELTVCDEKNRWLTSVSKKFGYNVPHQATTYTRKPVSDSQKASVFEKQENRVIVLDDELPHQIKFDANVYQSSWYQKNATQMGKHHASRIASVPYETNAVQERQFHGFRSEIEHGYEVCRAPNCSNPNCGFDFNHPSNLALVSKRFNMDLAPFAKGDFADKFAYVEENGFYPEGSYRNNMMDLHCHAKEVCGERCGHRLAIGAALKKRS